MNEVAIPQEQAGHEDAAWASLNTPLSVDELIDFCRDIIRLYRINPLLEFKKTEALGNQRYFFSGRNISQDPSFDFQFTLTVQERADGFEVEYDNGIKSGTKFVIESAPTGSKLTITDYYEGLEQSERESRLSEVDKSLVTWANYLQRFFIMWQKWSRFRAWRWYMRVIWQPMKPSSRRIVYMMWWISLVEIALIMLGVGIYFIEYA